MPAPLKHPLTPLEPVARYLKAALSLKAKIVEGGGLARSTGPAVATPLEE